MEISLILLSILFCFAAAEDIGLSRAIGDGSASVQMGGISFNSLNVDLGPLNDLRSALANIINRNSEVSQEAAPKISPIILNESEIAVMKKADYSVLVYSNGTNILVEDAKGSIISKRTAGSDDAAAIKEAINIIDRGTILCVGAFQINSPINNLKGNIHLEGMAGKTVFNCADMKTDIFSVGLEGSGYAASTTPLVDDVAEGSRTIKVSDASGYKEGDLVKLIDDESIIGFKKGEILKIQKINSNEILLEKGIQDDYSADMAANIRKLIMTDDIIIDGIKFIGPGTETDMSLFNLCLLRNFQFINNNVSDFGRAAIYLSDSLDATIENNSFENVFMTGLGYSIAITNACDNILINNNAFGVKGRHYITAGAGTGSRSSGGFSRNIRVINNTFEDCVQEAINSHPPFVGPIDIIGNKFESCAKGVEISNGNTVIVDNSFANCSIAIQLLGDEPRLHNIHSNEFKNYSERILIETSNMSIYGNICNGQFLVKRDEVEFL